MRQPDDEFEPLGAIEQFLLDQWRALDAPQGCRWIDNNGKPCGQPLTSLPTRQPYCEQHLRRSLRTGSWSQLLARAGLVS